MTRFRNPSNQFQPPKFPDFDYGVLVLSINNNTEFSNTPLCSVFIKSPMEQGALFQKHGPYQIETHSTWVHFHPRIMLSVITLSSLSAATPVPCVLTEERVALSTDIWATVPLLPFLLFLWIIRNVFILPFIDICNPINLPTSRKTRNCCFKIRVMFPSFTQWPMTETLCHWHQSWFLVTIFSHWLDLQPHLTPSHLAFLPP